MARTLLQKKPRVNFTWPQGPVFTLETVIITCWSYSSHYLNWTDWLLGFFFSLMELQFFSFVQFNSVLFIRCQKKTNNQTTSNTGGSRKENGLLTCRIRLWWRLSAEPDSEVETSCWTRLWWIDTCLSQTLQARCGPDVMVTYSVCKIFMAEYSSASSEFRNRLFWIFTL